MTLNQIKGGGGSKIKRMKLVKGSSTAKVKPINHRIVQTLKRQFPNLAHSNQNMELYSEKSSDRSSVIASYHPWETV